MVTILWAVTSADLATCSLSLAERLPAASTNSITASQQVARSRLQSTSLSQEILKLSDKIRTNSRHQFLSRGFCRITATSKKKERESKKKRKKRKNGSICLFPLWLSRSVSLQSCCCWQSMIVTGCNLTLCYTLSKVLRSKTGAY